MRSYQVAALALALLIVGAVGGYFLSPRSEVTVTKTVTQTLTEKETVTPPQGKIRAAFIYVGPIGDYGWTHAHHQAKELIDRRYDWLETTQVESVDPAASAGVMEQLISQGYNVIFTTSFDFMDPTLEEARKHPNVIFWHCSGYKRAPNMGTYFVEFYQVYYLNGLMAGALTKSKKIGYVAAHLIPEVVRHINAFAIGVKEVCPDCKVYVREIGAWFDPTKARQAAEALISEGVDILAFTEDSPTVVQVAQEHYMRGRRVLVFGHYSPMKEYGRDVCVSGQIAHWEGIYDDILSKIYAGSYTSKNLENVDYWWKLKEGAAELGCAHNEPINPKFVEELRSVRVKGQVQLPNGTVLRDPDAYTLVFARLAQMGAIWTGKGWAYVNDETFDPFTGPIYDNEGKLRVLPGQRIGHDELWSMQWWVDNVVGPRLGG
ncbi:MAG: BMP family ABC transporter substrate-binding protein [Candidatus Korarchaeum sp.]